MTGLDFSIVANNNDTPTIYLYDEDGSPVDVTPLAVKWQAFDPDGTPRITKTTAAGQIAKTVDPDTSKNPLGVTNGLAISIVPTDTFGLPQANYVHEAVTVDGGGLVVTVTNDDPILSYGTMFLRKQFTVQP